MDPWETQFVCCYLSLSSTHCPTHLSYCLTILGLPYILGHGPCPNTPPLLIYPHSNFKKQLQNFHKYLYIITIKFVNSVFITQTSKCWCKEAFRFVKCKGKWKGSASRKPHMLICVEKYVKLFKSFIVKNKYTTKPLQRSVGPRPSTPSFSPELLRYIYIYIYMIKH